VYEKTEEGSDNSVCSMSASPFDKNASALRTTDDGNAIRTAGNVFSVFSVKLDRRTGAFHDIIYSFAKNII